MYQTSEGYKIEKQEIFFFLKGRNRILISYYWSERQVTVDQLKKLRVLCQIMHVQATKTQLNKPKLACSWEYSTHFKHGESEYMDIRS